MVATHDETPHLLMESALPDSEEEGECPTAPPTMHGARWLLASCALAGMVFLGCKYHGQSPKHPKDDFSDQISSMVVKAGGTCSDDTSWKDAFGDKCDWYNTAERCGLASEYAKDGVDATEACCECGGGVGGGGGGGGGGGNGGGSAECGKKGGPSRRLGANSSRRLGGGLGPKIVNGVDADQCEWKWQVGLRRAGRSRPYCGGTLLSEEWVLTAAHCVADGHTNFEVVAGKYRTRRDDGNTQKSSVSKVVTHPDFSGRTLAFDVALIKLQSPLTMGDCVGAICLPEEGDHIPEKTDCWITGWGAIHEGGPRPAKLQEAMVEIHPQSDCRNKKNNSRIQDNMICAQGKTQDGGITDGCQGDSGGPLVCEVQGSWYIHGATSWGFGCADEAKPGVWSRITASSDWIQSTMGS